jgi:rod shape-determining protein MreD
MRPFFFYAVTLFGGFWLQIIQNHFLGGSLFSVQLLVIAVIYWGLSHGSVSAPLMGFVWGLLTDAASLGLLGERALLFAAVGFIAGLLRRQLDDTKPWTQAIFTLIASLGILLGEMLIDHCFLRGAHPVRASTWVQPVWNALAAPILFLLLRSWDMAWDIHGRHR